MIEFKVLQNNQRFMSSILRIDVEQEKNPWMKSADEFFTSFPVLLILFGLFSLLVASAVRMHNNSYDFTARLVAALLLIAMCQAIIIFLSIGVHIKKIVALYHTLQTITDNEGLIFFDSLTNECYFFY